MKGKTKVITIVVGVLVAVAVIVTVAVSVYYSNSVDVSKYVLDELVLDGTNGYREISKWHFINWDALLEDLGETKCENMTNPSWDDLIDDNIFVSVDGYSEFDENLTGLSNGDKVSIVVNFNYDNINRYDFDVKLRGDKEIKRTYTVSGLSDPVTVDPFEIVKGVKKEEGFFAGYTVVLDKDFYKEIGEYRLSYSNVTINYENYDSLEISTASGDKIGNVYFVDLTNGDEILVDLSKAPFLSRIDENFFVEKGIIFSEVRKTYEIP